MADDKPTADTIKAVSPMAYIRDHLFTPFGDSLQDLKHFKDANPVAYEDLRVQAAIEIGLP